MKLPPLNSLRLFEVAARHESFKRAAEELHVTPSAVSHAVQALEEWLGTELFHRGARVLTLTAVGSQLAVSASQGFSLLAAATNACALGKRRARCRSAALRHSRRDGCCRGCLDLSGRTRISRCRSTHRECQSRCHGRVSISRSAWRAGPSQPGSSQPGPGLAWSRKCWFQSVRQQFGQGSKVARRRCSRRRRSFM